MSYDISPSLSDLLQTVSIWHSLGSSMLLLMALLKVAQSCQTLYDPMGYTVHGILQARILEWIAFPFSGGSSQPSTKCTTIGRKELAPCSIELHRLPLPPQSFLPLSSLALGLTHWKWQWKSLSLVGLFVNPWTIQSMEFCRPEYWSG